MDWKIGDYFHFTDGKIYGVSEYHRRANAYIIEEYYENAFDVPTDLSGINPEQEVFQCINISNQNVVYFIREDLRDAVRLSDEESLVWKLEQ